MSKESSIYCDVLVIGSGPGGAMTSMILSEAGVKVCLVEEGQSYSLDSAAAYSLEEMEQKYRRSAMTLAFGNPKLTYIEGCCVGGASEINAGLYNEPVDEILNQWAVDYQIADFDLIKLRSLLKDNAELLGLTFSQEGLGPGSRVLKKGGDQLGFIGMEIPRVWKYQTQQAYGRRQSMSVSLIPRAIKSGCRLISSAKVRRLELKGAVAVKALLEDGRQVFFKQVIICAGAIQTPFLLRRSGITNNVGNSLMLHPAIRTIARFDEPVSDANEGVPVYQITAFKPELTLGGSYSSQAHLALWLAGRQDFRSLIEQHDMLGMFYALIRAKGKGCIRHLPGIDDPLVTFHLTDDDLKQLGEGLYRLGEVLFAAGAKEIFSPLKGNKVGVPDVFRSLSMMKDLRRGLPREGIECSSLHLFSSCPMGEAKACPLDSWGKLKEGDNLYVNDASMLPSPPGANPQAIIMAIARRNAHHFLTYLK